MLQIYVPEKEIYDEEHNEFLYIKGRELHLEHSLISISKWESKWKKPYLSNEKRTNEEIIDYVRCMTIDKSVDYYLYYALTTENFNEISNYIGDSMTATWFRDTGSKVNSGEAVTSELIYFWMVSYNIPFECEKWHLNRLLTLIKICNIKNQPEKKMNRRAILEQNKALNDARRARMHTRG